MSYWKDVIEEAFEDAGISATKEQIGTVESWAESAHDNYGMAHGHDDIPNPLHTEIKEINAAHTKEIERKDRENYRDQKERAFQRDVAENTVYNLRKRISELEGVS